MKVGEKLFFDEDGMRKNPQNYYKLLERNIRKPIVKIELLTRDERVVDSFTANIVSTGGNVTIIKQNGCRRSIQFTLINVDGKYIPKDEGRIWVRKKVVVYLGFNIDDQMYWISQGVFVLDNPVATSATSSKTVEIKALDKFSLLDGTLGGELSENYILPAGSNVYQAIRSLLSLADDPASSCITLEPNVITTYAIEKMAGDKLGDILLELASMLSYNVFYDRHGMLRFQPEHNENYNPIVQNFNTTRCFNYLGASQEYKFSELYNAVLIIGDNIGGSMVSYKAVNNNIQSDMCVNHLGFERCKVITDTNISTVEQARDRALYELKRITYLQSSIKLSSMPMYHLDVDEVIELSDPALELEEAKFLIMGMQIPFGTDGTMNIDAAQILPIEE
jgi:hypothetical protein